MYDVLIIGGGAAGLSAAIRAKSNNKIKCAVVSKVHPLRSQTCMAQGGMNAALSNNNKYGEDSIDKHIKDTIKGGFNLSDQNAVELFCEKAPECVIKLEHMGMIFSRDQQGKIAQRPFGGAKTARTCFSRDYTGHNLLSTLYSNCIKNDIQIYDEHFCNSIITENEKVKGIAMTDIKTGELKTVPAKAVIIATGGLTSIYKNNVNSVTTKGDGIALAFLAGANLKDMEFIQFHPTSLADKGILLSEAARGEGGYLINSNHERFVDELSSRDTVSQAIQNEIDGGRGVNGHVFLDLRHLGTEKIKKRLPQIQKIVKDFYDIDCAKELIPVKPAAHYIMGGIETNLNCETNIKGLFAAGESACISIHGANRLGGNSLMETIVFGKIAGENASKYAVNTESPDITEINFNEPQFDKGEIPVSDIKDELAETMDSCAGIKRSEPLLQKGLDKIKEFKEKYKNIRIENTSKIFNQEKIEAYELKNMLTLAEVILKSAKERKESRGAHKRTDYKNRDDSKYLKHTIARYKEEGDLQISYKDVTITNYYPE
jgi:succinate dehydrogenase / fumarate reductase flavoprotein subunit